MMFPLLSTILLTSSLLTPSTALTPRQAPSDLPPFVLDYAPIVYLHSADPNLPSDIRTHLSNTEARTDYARIPSAPSPLTLSNLDSLNEFGNDGDDVYLTVQPDDAVPDAGFLRGTTPNEAGETEDATTSVVIVNDKGDGVVDVFYFYFYSFDWGGRYLGMNIGNHVADWEHNMVRFRDGEPRAVWYSQHAQGQAFEYQAVEKEGRRPVVYSANGTHANYAIDGRHAHAIPNFNLPDGIVADETDRGVRWDPVLSAYFYSFDAGEESFSAYCDSTPVDYLYFKGHWGDEQYPESDERQENYFGWIGIDELWKYVGGPTGPVHKQLDREEVCPDNGIRCIIWPFLKP